MDHFADDLYQHQNPTACLVSKRIKFPITLLVMTIALAIALFACALGSTPAWSFLPNLGLFAVSLISLLFRMKSWIAPSESRLG